MDISNKPNIQVIKTKYIYLYGNTFIHPFISIVVIIIPVLSLASERLFLTLNRSLSYHSFKATSRGVRGMAEIAESLSSQWALDKYAYQNKS